MAYAVLTRESIEAYAAALAPLGLEAVAMPVTRYESLGAKLDTTCDFIVVASPRAAHELLAAPPPTGEVWALGAATARALANIPAIVPDGVVDGRDLARALAPKVRGKRVLVPRAEDARPELREILRAGGAEVVDVIAYRTIALAGDAPQLQRGLELVRGGSAAMCVVFAPSQADALFALVAPAVPFVAIGETTAAALRAHGVSSVAVAPTPMPEGIAIAVRAVYPKPT